MAAMSEATPRKILVAPELAGTSHVYPSHLEIGNFSTSCLLFSREHALVTSAFKTVSSFLASVPLFSTLSGPSQ